MQLNEYIKISDLSESSLIWDKLLSESSLIWDTGIHIFEMKLEFGKKSKFKLDLQRSSF